MGDTCGLVNRIVLKGTKLDDKANDSVSTVPLTVHPCNINTKDVIVPALFIRGVTSALNLPFSSFSV